MKAELPVRRRQIHSRNGAESRERLLQVGAQRGLTKMAFCTERQIKLHTF